ncbi:FecR domain-containing protein [Bdellovibrio sp. 22V]|uniref:FecR domain-containing protein n=1 Tax=Bdellovibrio TaxID=958 RepID=UPI00254350C4|nr:FecR domain-containing protein [Bdellovibrio sp. 22V]WII73801.1 FecR domain-containing protein [Bdellovibrio sp. 22V]
MSRFGQTEKIIFACAMVALMVFSYFLYDDSLLFPKNVNGKLELIGDVAISQNDVRRKNLDTFSWVPASRKDYVYQNDSIFTGDRSEATIQLQDGTQIKIEPNSLITLNLKNGQMNLDLRYGNLTGELAKGASLTIKSGTEEFKLEAKPEAPEKSKIQFKKAHSGTVDLKLLSGDVKYVDKKKQAVQELPKNAVVAVTKKGEVKQLEKPELYLKTADNINWLRINPDDPLPFEWQSKGDVARYELEISPHEDFSSIAVSKLTNEMKAQVVEPLEPGSYYWRLKALDRDGHVSLTSPSQRMSITHLAGPQIVTPQQAAQINLELKVKPKEELATTTEVQWKAQPSLKTFTWQVSQDPEFQTVLKEGQTNTLAALTPKLPAGTYYVRVQGQTESQKLSPWSEPVSFTLNLFAHKEERPARPVLVTKKVEFTPPSGKDRNPASPQAPKLAWKPVLQTKNYHLQIARDASFAEAEKYDVNQNQVEWSQYRPGKYFYRVFAKGLNGLTSEPSETGTIEITAGGIILDPLKTINAIGQQPGPKETPISWTEVPFAKSYLVQVDTSKEFKQPQQMEYSSLGGTLTLNDPGRYNVRVQALDENNKPLTEFSNIEEVLYTFRAPLVAPSLMEPFNNASIFLQTEMEPFIWLEWKKVEGATSYRIEISDKADFSRTLIAKSLAGNRYLIKDRVPLGKIYWRVRAESKDDSESSEWAEKREFTLYHQKNETFVK